MDVDSIIAHWTGKLPEGFVRPPLLQQALPECSQRRRYRRPVSVKKNVSAVTQQPPPMVTENSSPR